MYKEGSELAPRYSGKDKVDAEAHVELVRWIRGTLCGF
jgi:hypothetical protein